MTTKILLGASLLALLAGCSNDRAPLGAPAAPTRVSTAGAQRVAGDVAPRRLVALHVPKPVETTVIHGSDALAPNKPFPIESPPVPVTSRDLHRVMQGTDPAAFRFPIDAPDGALIIVRALDPHASLVTVHVHDVATGLRLDHARDATTPIGAPRQLMDPSGARAGGPGAVDDPGRPDGPIPHTRLNPDPQLSAGRETGFAPLALPTRQLSIDEPYAGGIVQLDVPANVAAGGVVVEVQQPRSHVAISGAPAELNYGFGDEAEIDCTLAAEGAEVAGVTVTATATSPDHSGTFDVSFTPAGGGKYVARVPLSSSDWSGIGVYALHVRGAGTAGGVAFERDFDTAFGYYPAHAQMTAFHAPVVTRGQGGLVDEISVDVDVETLADDRFSLRGTLTYTGDDGQEHGLASAQTGQALAAGNGTITLHFEAPAMALAGVDGPFHLRDVALVSQAFGFTQHRLGRGLDLATGAIAAREIRYPSALSIRAQDLVDNGDLELRRR
jgi:hypothetical protein